jgi:hypothetical protein
VTDELSRKELRVRTTVFLILVLLIAVAPEAVVGACQAAVVAALEVLGQLLGDAGAAGAA